MIEKFQPLEKYVRKSSKAWKFFAVLFPIIGTCAMAQGPGGLTGFFQAWWGTQRFDPTGINGLVAWYDASDATTISVQAATTNVTQWADKSTNAVNLTVPSTVYPKYVATSQNGLGGISFSGASNDRLQFTNSNIFANKQYAYVFAVAKHSANQNYATIYGARFEPQLLNIYARSSQLFEAGGRRLPSDSYQGVNLSWPSNQTAVVSGFFQWSDAALTAGVNNTATNRSGGFQAAGNSSTNLSAISVGANSNNTEPYRGLIYEIIAYDRKLSDSEITQVKSYLYAKWGITL